MTLLQAIFLGILQGITEFLPISSSGHLVLGEALLQLDVAELKDFDIVVHVGTLLAIVIYFWRDFFKPKLWPWLIFGSIPAALVGFTLEDHIDAIFRSALAVGIVMIMLGLIFQIPEDILSKKKDKKLTWPRVLLIGIAQSIAIIPGVSRSGSTIFIGTLAGLKREEAARFSFLLGSIAIGGAGLLTALDLGTVSLDTHVLAAGFLAALISGFFAITWLMKFLKHHPLQWFGIYLIALGAITVGVNLFS